MNDPLSTFERLRDLYVTYLETAFRIGAIDIQSARRHLLEQSDALCTDPYLEPQPRYKSSEVRIDQLVGPEGEVVLEGFDANARRILTHVAMAGLLPSRRDPATGVQIGEFELYSHQLEMLRRGIRARTPAVVTSGTGSGKTESFLLPILATIVREAIGWPASPDLASWTPWWRPNGETSWRDLKINGPAKGLVSFARAREAATRPKAVRALILSSHERSCRGSDVRLRRALDSDAVHEVMDKELGGNRIFFGRYTSATPVTGWLHHPRLSASAERARVERRVRDLYQASSEAEATWLAARREVERARKAKEEFDELLPFNFSRPIGAEVISRWDMQAFPPDILITNTSMLSAMLSREIDEPIWQQTKDWLVNNPDAYFYLVLDELHLQRGTAGTEVAFLLKLLTHRLGLDDPQHRHKLRVLASSASLPLEGEALEESVSYLWDMFGTGGLGRDGQREDWANAVVPGETITTPSPSEVPDAYALMRAIADIIGTAEDDTPPVLNTPWKTLADLMRVWTFPEFDHGYHRQSGRAP